MLRFSIHYEQQASITSYAVWSQDGIWGVWLNILWSWGSDPRWKVTKYSWIETILKNARSNHFLCRIILEGTFAFFALTARRRQPEMVFTQHCLFTGVTRIREPWSRRTNGKITRPMSGRLATGSRLLASNFAAEIMSGFSAQMYSSHRNVNSLFCFGLLGYHYTSSRRVTIKTIWTGDSEEAFHVHDERVFWYRCKQPNGQMCNPYIYQS